MSTTNIVDGTWMVNALYLQGPGVGVAPSVLRVTTDPNGSVSQYGGSLALDPVNGVTYTNLTSGSISGMTWAPLAHASSAGRNATCRIFSLTSTVANFGDNAGSSTYAPYTLPAVLQAGSTLRFRIAGNLSQAGAGTARFQLYAQGALTTLLADSGALAFANNTPLVMDVSTTIRSTGLLAGTASSVTGALAATPLGDQVVSTGLNTFASNTISLVVTFSAPGLGTNVDLHQFEISLAQ